MGEFILKGYLHEAVLEYVEDFLRQELLDQRRIVKVKSYSSRSVDHEVHKWLMRYRRLRDRRTGPRREFLNKFIENREEAESLAHDNIASLLVTVRAPHRRDAQLYASALGDLNFQSFGLKCSYLDDGKDALLRRVYRSDCGSATLNTEAIFAVLSREEYQQRYVRNQ